MNARVFAGVATLALAVTSCGILAPTRRATQHTAPSVRTSTGVLYEELLQGIGAPAALGDEVLLDYVVSLEDGTRVDSTLDRGLPVPVRLGEAFLRGLDDGLLGIRADGRRRIVVPPELGYGDAGVVGLVPPGATLVFEVHAIELRPRKH